MTKNNTRIIKNSEQLSATISNKLDSMKIVDMHTHLFDPCFKEYNLYGIDNLLTYHYLISETFRQNPSIEYAAFNALSTKEKAETVWKTLFVDNTPVSEVTRSIITIFRELGLETNNKDLEYYRNYFNTVNMDEYIDKIFNIAGLERVIMTNDPFDDIETAKWDSFTPGDRDSRFGAALRLDCLIMNPDEAFSKLHNLGIISSPRVSLEKEKVEAIKTFLSKRIDAINAEYCAVSMPPDFDMEDGSVRNDIIEKCVIPLCIEKNKPFGLMIGVRRRVNPYLELAGDAPGKVTLNGLEYVVKNHPKLKVLATVLTMEDQHGLAVLSRKFKNLLVFGCWWFVNNPSLIEQITRMRTELLGTTYIPQHSDCRVLEQLISKWIHSKTIMVKIFTEKYTDLMSTGYELSEFEVERDMDKFFITNYTNFIS